MKRTITPTGYTMRKGNVEFQVSLNNANPRLRVKLIKQIRENADKQK